MKNKNYYNKTHYFCITPYYPSNKSFIGSYIHDQIKAIKKHSKYYVHVIKLNSFWTKNRQSHYYFDGIKVYNYYHIDFPFWILPGFFKKINQKLFFNFLIKIKKHINHTDVFHCHVAYPSSILVEKIISKFSCKLFIQHHGFDFLNLNNGPLNKNNLKIYNSKRLPFFKRVNRIFIEKYLNKSIHSSDLNVCVSNKLAQLIEGYTSGQSEVYTLYNGVDLDKFFYRLILQRVLPQIKNYIRLGVLEISGHQRVNFYF